VPHPSVPSARYLAAVLGLASGSFRASLASSTAILARYSSQHPPLLEQYFFVFHSVVFRCAAL
jgi:hypothetical protein